MSGWDVEAPAEWQRDGEAPGWFGGFFGFLGFAGHDGVGVWLEDEEGDGYCLFFGFGAGDLLRLEDGRLLMFLTALVGMT